VEGYATTFDEPYLIGEFEGNKYYELVERRALDSADITDVIMQYDHSGKVYARMKNNTLIVEPDSHGLFICSDLSKSAGAKELYDEISAGLITSMSWAFTVGESVYDKDTRTRIFKRVNKVYDVSAVSIPANDNTNISARSYIDGLIEKEQRESLLRKAALFRLKLIMEGIK
jgi:HK97 family phage prohead protease